MNWQFKWILIFRGVYVSQWYVYSTSAPSESFFNHWNRKGWYKKDKKKERWMTSLCDCIGKKPSKIPTTLDRLVCM